MFSYTFKSLVSYRASTLIVRNLRRYHFERKYWYNSPSIYQKSQEQRIKDHTELVEMDRKCILEICENSLRNDEMRIYYQSLDSTSNKKDLDPGEIENHNS